MRRALAAAVAVTAMVAAPGTAGADPDPTPPSTPGYQIAGPSGPQFPGVQVYPPICLQAPLDLRAPLRSRHRDVERAVGNRLVLICI
jgi:hypothetical protein